MLATSRSRVDYLTQSLQLVTNELQSTIELELHKLKAEEEALKSALKLKTRQELITTMERELEMEPLYANDFSTQTNLRGSTNSLYKTNLNQSLRNTNNLSESIHFSNENLKLGNLLLNKLNDECLICSTDLKSTGLNDHQTEALDFLSQSATNSLYKNQFGSEDVFVNPNVVRIILKNLITHNKRPRLCLVQGYI